jgi:S-methylmethionine-dependent homocysteine/selenocysteine methylase
VTYAAHVQALPRVGGMTCVTDGGMETTLLFHRGIELPCFATFPLLASSEGTAELRRCFESYVARAAERGLTAVLDTPTWRANADWARSSAATPATWRRQTEGQSPCSKG